MNRRAGFTLIELLITITIMVILMTLAVLGLRSSMADARDERRRTDVEVIARGLERRYNDGNPRASSSDIEIGSYPGNNEMWHALGWDRSNFNPTIISGGYLTDLLPGTKRENFFPSGTQAIDLMCIWACQPAETQSVIDQQVTTDKYIYEPVDRNGNICPGNGCVRFNLYWRSEVDDTIHVVKSKNQ